jgi:ABC-type glycerol-3-phosphate transport system substrate-binding protein
MKKLIALLLCLMLTLPALAEKPQTFTIPIDENKGEWAQIFPLNGGMLCRKNDRSYYYLNPEGTVLVPLTAQEPDPHSLEYGTSRFQANSFVEDGGKSYGIFSTDTKMFAVPVTLSGDTLSFGEAVELDCEHRLRFEGSGEGRQNAFLENGDRFVLAGDTLYVTQANVPENNELDSYNILTGEYAPFPVQRVLNIFPYQDGKLLITHAVGGDQYQSGAEFFASVLDPKNSSTEEIVRLGEHFEPYTFSQVYYDKNTDYLLYVNNMHIYGVKKGGSEELRGYKASRYMDLVLLSGGKFAGIEDDAIHLITADGNLPSETLRVFGAFGDEEARSMMSDVMFTDIEVTNDVVTLGQALVSGALKTDALSMNSSVTSPKPFIQKGYLADLKDVPGVKEYTDSLYPFLQEAFTKDGGIYAVPVQIGTTSLGYRKTLLDSLGYEVPKTFGDFCAIATDFYQNHADDEDITFLDSPANGPWFFSKMVNLYLYTRLQMGLSLELDTPEFHEMLAAYESLPAAYKTSGDETGPDPWMEIDGKQALFFSDGEASPYSLTYVLNELAADKDNAYSSLPLVLSAWEGAPPIQTFYVEYVGVYAQSPNMETAFRYIENLVKTIYAEHLACMVEKYNQPMEESLYERTILNLQGQLDAMLKKAEKAEGAEKTQLLKDYEDYKKTVDFYQQYGKYSISLEGLEYYQTKVMIAPVMDIAHPLLGWESPLHELINRHFEGQMPIEQLIKEFDQKSKLITLEQQ